MAFDWSKVTVHGLIGDTNASDHGGGIVFTGDYGPHLEYTHGAESDAPDSDPEVDEITLEVYTVPLYDSAQEFFEYYDWIDWANVSQSIGASEDDSNTIAFGTVMERAGAVEAAAMYYGWREFDDAPSDVPYNDVDTWYEVWRVQHNARLQVK